MKHFRGDRNHVETLQQKAVRKKHSQRHSVCICSKEPSPPATSLAWRKARPQRGLYDPSRHSQTEAGTQAPQQPVVLSHGVLLLPAWGQPATVPAWRSHADQLHAHRSSRYAACFLKHTSFQQLKIAHSEKALQVVSMRLSNSRQSHLPWSLSRAKLWECTRRADVQLQAR